MRANTEPVVEPDDFVASIAEGGTSAFDLDDAAKNLKLVTTSMVGQPDGPIGLDGTGKIDQVMFPAVAGTNKVSLQGAFSVIVGQTIQLRITDYDSFKNYQLTADVGTISRADDLISYTAPLAVGTANISVNGRQLPVSVLPSQPQQPSIIVPANGSTGTNTTLNFQSSAFASGPTPDTHASTDWQISTDPNFTTITQQIVNDSINKTTWSPAALTAGVQYFTRVRYKGASGQYSQYSSVSTFTTQQLTPPTVDLNPTVTGEASGSFFQVIGTYTGTVQSYVAKLDGVVTSLGISFSGGSVYWNGGMPYSFNGAVLTVEVTNSGGTNSDTSTINITPAPFSALQTQNWSFPVGQAIPTFSGGRKWVAMTDIIGGSVNSGAAPPGVSFSYSQGGNRDVIVAGTPTAIGTYTFTLSVDRYSEYSGSAVQTTPQITLTITA
jgi:hypothetical protein